jgi:hypothetical protein
MSKDQIADAINETKIGEKTSTLLGLVLAIGAKYGLPSLVCIWLFYVIYQKDLQLYSITKETTAALVDNSNAVKDLAEAVKEIRANR